MDHHGFPTASQHTTADEMIFPAYLESRDFDEEHTEDPLTSAATQQVSICSGQTPFQAHYNDSSLSQPGQIDLGNFARWEGFLAADDMTASSLMSLQEVNYMSPNAVSFQAPASSETGWVYPNPLQPRHDIAAHQIQSNCSLLLDAPLGEATSTVGGHVPYHDAGWQPVNFEAIQEPNSALVPHISSTHSTTTFMRHPTTINPVSFKPLQVPEVSDIMANGPLDFAEIERQSLQSSSYKDWQQVAQTDLSSVGPTSLDAQQIPDIIENGARLAHSGLVAPPTSMVLPTRRRESPQLVDPATYSEHLPIAPRPHIPEISFAASSTSQALVPSAFAPRKLLARATSKGITKPIQGPRRPNKHSKRQGLITLESLPGYNVYPLELSNKIRKHNSRYGKKLDTVAMMTRKKGACILCRHHNKKVC